MSLRFLARPKWIAWTLVVVVAVVIMANLALWQYDRLIERRADNEVIAERMDDPPGDVTALLTAPGEPDALAAAADEAADDHEHRPVSATGTYDTDGEFLVANQTLGGAPGWWVVTPLVLDSGEVVAVNRGWVPFADVEPDDSFDEFAPPGGQVEVTGPLRSSQREVEPASQARTMPRLDLVQMQRQSDAAVMSMWIQLASQNPEQAGDVPVPLPEPELDDGPHLNYTGQWIIFAALTIIVFVVLVVRTAQRGGDRPEADEEPEDSDEPAL